jgi:hypothetical protein
MCMRRPPQSLANPPSSQRESIREPATMPHPSVPQSASRESRPRSRAPCHHGNSSHIFSPFIQRGHGQPKTKWIARLRLPARWSGARISNRAAVSPRSAVGTLSVSLSFSRVRAPGWGVTQYRATSSESAPIISRHCFRRTTYGAQSAPVPIPVQSPPGIAAGLFPTSRPVGRRPPARETDNRPR